VKIFLDFICLTDNMLKIEDYTEDIRLDNIFVVTNNDSCKAKRVERGFLNDHQSGFSVFVDFDQFREISFVLENKKVRLHTRRWTELGNISGAYRILGDKILRKHRKQITVRSASRLRYFLYEIVFLLRIFVNFQLPHASSLIRTKSPKTVLRVLRYPYGRFL